MSALTRRESTVLELAGCGYSSKYVAARLHLSPRTVDTHITRIYEKLGINCRDQLIDYARREK